MKKMTHSFKSTVLILVFPLFVPGQSISESRRQPEARPVAKILRHALQKIRNQAKAPIYLPSKLPSSIDVDEIHLVEGEVKPDGWGISLSYEAGCGNACLVGYFEAKRGESVSRGDVDKVVRLTNGISGYYAARACGVSCAPPQINWVYNGVLYSIQFNVHNKAKRRDEAEIVALANSAIRGGAR